MQNKLYHTILQSHDMCNKFWCDRVLRKYYTNNATDWEVGGVVCEVY